MKKYSNSVLLVGLALALFLSKSQVVADTETPPPDFDINDMMNQQCPNYRCSADMTPTPKSRLKFSSTGCSTLGAGSMMMTGADGAAEKPYASCCDAWHACYQICGVSKATCDTAFETCAKESCQAGNDTNSESCTKDAELSVMMMKLGGCQSFNQAQYAACDCTPKKKAWSAREAALRYFYKKFAPDSVDKAANLATKADTASKMAGLFIKLLAKYPEAIVKKEDPMKEMYEKIRRESEQKTKETVTEEEEVPSDEHIDL